MEILNKVILSSVLVVSTASADSTLENILKDKNIFVGTTLGYTHIITDKKDTQNSVTLTEKLNKNGLNLQFEIGTKYSNNLETSINYQRVQSDDVNLDNMFLTIRYKFPQEKFIPYVGANLGYSQLSWNNSPVTTLSNDMHSSSYLVGLNTGILYSISTKVDINFNYQLNYTDHKANMETTTAKGVLHHNFLSSLNVGVRYNF